jgi:DNA damage-inducible protein 1
MLPFSTISLSIRDKSGYLLPPDTTSPQHPFAQWLSTSYRSPCKLSLCITRDRRTLEADLVSLSPHRRITLSINNPEAEDQDLLSLDIFSDMTLETLRSSIHAETRIEPNNQHLYHNGQLISDNTKTMDQLQIADGEMLALHVRDMRGSTGVPATREQQPRRAPTGQDPELVRLQLLGSPPEYREELRRTQPQLAQALDDPTRFASAFRDVYDRERRERADRQRQIAALNSDPFDIEAQEKIAEIIRQEQVMENLQNAMEHNPEGKVGPPTMAASSHHPRGRRVRVRLVR